MRTARFVLVALLIAAPVSAESNPLRWASNRKAADWLSTGLVAGNIVGETLASLHAPDRKHALGCQALRTGIALGAAEGTKLLVHRTRPDGSDRKSFFSEHTALATVSTGWRFGVSIPIAMGAGYGRGAADKHYLTDIATGALVGLLARTVCH
jgi:membrane-associated phospholipid phosphatase